MHDWPRMLDDLTGGSFAKRVIDIWPVGEDLVVARMSRPKMTIGDVYHHGSGVVVHRLADRAIVEGFDIQARPSSEPAGACRRRARRRDDVLSATPNCLIESEVALRGCSS
jgi:hypothetical protein